MWDNWIVHVYCIPCPSNEIVPPSEVFKKSMCYGECSPNALVVAFLKGCENIRQTLRTYS